ncbi:DinB family protein [Sphingobacterium suaedae]|uniref:DinB family protein n=1 Tax=Sphingobacterium suaedae TaxID=1686402 RepID=A0ABW5KN05_9SPHI
MESAQQLAFRFREVTLNGTWIANTNYKLALSTVTFEQATTKIGSLNSIALLTYHLHYYMAGVTEAMRTGQLTIKDSLSFGMSPLASDQEWQQLKENFLSDSEQFADEVESLTEQQLQEIFIDARYGTYRRNIESMIEHAYYHLGQVVLLSKLIKERAEESIVG